MKQQSEKLADPVGDVEIEQPPHKTASLSAASPRSIDLPQGPLLGFRDAQLEKRYLQQEFTHNRMDIADGLVLGLILVVVVYGFDAAIAPERSLATFHLIRFGLLTPVTVAALIGVLLVKDATQWHRLAAALLIIFGLSWTFLLTIGGTLVISYLSLAMLQSMVGGFVLLGLPFRWSAPIVVLCSIAFVVTACIEPLGSNLPLPWSVPLGGVIIVAYAILLTLSAFGAFRYERAARRQFIAQTVLEVEHAERLASESDRNRWLSVIANFLRHELHNSITGVSSSLELAARARQDNDVHRYLERANRSIHFMRRMLQQASEATSLETVLSQQSLEPLDLSDLIAGRIQDLRDEVPARQFTAAITSKLMVMGDAESLVQMLDKLINNAIEHGHADSPIRVELHAREYLAAISISDIGDSLPEDSTLLFEPFVSHKKTSPSGGNLGLGLYVARTIAIRHGGDIRAEQLRNPDGARMIVTLPRIPH